MNIFAAGKYSYSEIETSLEKLITVNPEEMVESVMVPDLAGDQLSDLDPGCVRYVMDPK
jgi:hypothetical protein